MKIFIINFGKNTIDIFMTKNHHKNFVDSLKSGRMPTVKYFKSFRMKTL